MRPSHLRASQSGRPRQIPRSSLEPVGLEDQQIPCSADRVSSRRRRLQHARLLTQAALVARSRRRRRQGARRGRSSPFRRYQRLGLVQIRSRRTRLTPGCGRGSVPDARSPGRLRAGAAAPRCSRRSGNEMERSQQADTADREDYAPRTLPRPCALTPAGL